MRARELLRRTGFDLTRHPHAKTLTGELGRVLHLERWTAVLDVGANVGQFATSMRRMGYRGPLVSFEPDSASIATLADASASDANWHIRPVALGRASGEAVLHQFIGSDLSSLHNALPGTVKRFKNAVPTGTSTVQVRTLLDFHSEIRELAPVGPWLLKCDTQGHDLDVLEGGLGNMAEVSTVLTELSVIPLYEAQPSMSVVLERMAEWGFLPIGMFPVSRTADGLGVIEFDGLFTRADREPRLGL